MSGLASGLKKLNLSGVQEFIPNNMREQQQQTAPSAAPPNFRNFSPSMGIKNGGNMRLNPTGNGNSPQQLSSPQNPAAAAGDLPGGSPGDITTFSDGGTTYFYNSDEMVSKL